MHPFDTSIKRLNPELSQDAAQELLLSLMQQWSQLTYRTNWQKDLSTILWARIIAVDPTQFRKYSAFELSLLDRIARTAVLAEGWWTAACFLTTEEWEQIFNHASSNTVAV